MSTISICLGHFLCSPSPHPTSWHSHLTNYMHSRSDKSAAILIITWAAVDLENIHRETVPVLSLPSPEKLSSLQVVISFGFSDYDWSHDFQILPRLYEVMKPLGAEMSSLNRLVCEHSLVWWCTSSHNCCTVMSGLATAKYRESYKCHEFLVSGHFCHLHNGHKHSHHYNFHYLGKIFMRTYFSRR